MNKFVKLPLDKMLNRENPISRIERLERGVIYPSIVVGNLGEISNDIGDQVAGRYSIIDSATGQILGTLSSEDGIQLLAEGALAADRGYKFVDINGVNAAGLYCYVDGSNNTWLRLRQHGQNASPFGHAYLDAVASSGAYAHMTADSGASTDTAPDFTVQQTTDNRAVFNNFDYIDFGGAVPLNFSGSTTFLPFGIYLDIGPFSATNKYPYSATVDRDLTLAKFSASILVTPNDTSNYWDIELYEWGSDTLLATLTTKNATANARTLLTTTTFSDSTMTASNLAVYIKLVKVLNPGNLYLLGPQLEVSG